MTPSETAPAASFAEATRDLLRTRVLDAVGELASTRPWSEVKMAEVAMAAGVSRQTLYNAFGSRDEMAREYVAREGDRFADAVEAAIRHHAPDARAALTAALDLFLTAAETHPLIRSIATGEASGDEFLPLLTTRGGTLVSGIRDRLSDLIEEHWPVPRADTDNLADALVRLGISHAALPAGTPSGTARKLVVLLGPFVDEAVAKAQT